MGCEYASHFSFTIVLSLSFSTDPFLEKLSHLTHNLFPLSAAEEIDSLGSSEHMTLPFVNGSNNFSMHMLDRKGIDDMNASDTSTFHFILKTISEEEITVCSFSSSTYGVGEVYLQTNIVDGQSRGGQVVWCPGYRADHSVTCLSLSRYVINEDKHYDKQTAHLIFRS